jgi:hypothetical protein
MFSACVARGIAEKLVYKTVGGKVETSLHCSTALATPAAVASGPQKKGRKCPDNERRKMSSGGQNDDFRPLSYTLGGRGMGCRDKYVTS